jgi:hypothetical protein
MTAYNPFDAHSVDILVAMTRKYNGISLLIFILCLGAIWIRWNAGARTIDDSYITYRYARNILAGKGFVYNPAEHVLGTTTPLYTLLLSIIALPLGGADANFPQISLILNAVVDGLNCYLLFRLGEKLHSHKVGAATSLAWAIAPYSVTFSIGGLETSVYIFCLLNASYGYITKNIQKSALFSSLACLTRPDALILVLLLTIDYFLAQIQLQFSIKKRQLKFRCQSSTKELQQSITSLMIFMIPVTLWVLFSTYYFRSPIPNSMVAKSVAYRLPAYTALIRFLQHYATPFFENLILHSGAILIGLFIYPSLALFGSIQILRNHPRAFPVLLFPWLYFAAFSIANPLIFRWYLTPPLPFYFLTIFSGASSLLEYILQSIHHAQTQKTILPTLANSVLLFFIPTLFVSQAWALHPDHGLPKPAPRMAWYQLELLYAQAATYINSITPSSATDIVIAAGDVGVIGYYTQTIILDTVGLNSPQTLRYYPTDEKFYVINYAIPPKLINDYLPEYVVILEVYGRKGLLVDPTFRKNYQLDVKLDTDIYGSDGLLIFSRK